MWALKSYWAKAGIEKKAKYSEKLPTRQQCYQGNRNLKFLYVKLPPFLPHSLYKVVKTGGSSQGW